MVDLGGALEHRVDHHVALPVEPDVPVIGPLHEVGRAAVLPVHLDDPDVHCEGGNDPAELEKLTDDDLADHTTHARWLGEPIALDVVYEDKSTLAREFLKPMMLAVSAADSLPAPTVLLLMLREVRRELVLRAVTGRLAGRRAEHDVVAHDRRPAAHIDAAVAGGADRG